MLIESRTIKILLFVTFTGFMTSCVTTKYQAPATNIPADYRSGIDTSEYEKQSNNHSDPGIASIPYKKFFTDPLLLRLIDSGIAKNYNLQIALKQIDIAAEGMKQAKWGYAPTVGLTAGQASITRSSDNSMNGMMASQFLGKSYILDYTSNVNISWQADIWGKIKSRKEAALASYLQTREAEHAIQTRLVSDIAQGYYNLLMLDAQIAITNKSIALYDSSINMTKLLRDAGNVTSLAVQQQEAAKEQALASLPQLRQQLAIQENALSILTGQNPGKIERTNSLQVVQLHDALPVGFPANIVSNRPDIRQAEQSLMQAHALMNVSRASMYPNLSITAQGGLNSFEFNNWFNIPGSLFGMVAGAITQPILQGRQLKTQYEQSKLAREQSELNFKQTILAALGEVSNALIAIDELEKQESHTARQSAILEQTIGDSRLLFLSGQAGYLEILTAQNSKLQSDLALAGLQRQRLNAEVLLYQAVGGGWQ